MWLQGQEGPETWLTTSLPPTLLWPQANHFLPLCLSFPASEVRGYSACRAQGACGPGYMGLEDQGQPSLTTRARGLAFLELLIFKQKPEHWIFLLLRFCHTCFYHFEVFKKIEV